MKKMLIVTYVFPPFAAVGVFRIIKFCKFLTEFGFAPVILAADNPDVMARDESLLGSLNEDIKVYRTPVFEPLRPRPETEISSDKVAPEPSSENSGGSPERMSVLSRVKKPIRKLISVPDTHRFWIWTGLNEGLRAIRESKIDVILSSSPPVSTHILASRLARLTGRPHFVDFRDLWTQNTSYADRKLSWSLQVWDRWLERRVLKKAAGITCNTDTFKRQLLDNNSFLKVDRIEMVTNGIDSADFENLRPDRTGNDKFTMVYSGSVYGRHRNPAFFFAAVQEWLNKRPGVASQVAIDFYGNWDPHFVGMESEFELDGVVRRHGWVPQQDVMSRLLGADLLLLFQGFDPILASAIPRKLYDYVVLNRPILAFAPPGEIPGLISQYQCGISFSDGSPGPIVEVLDREFEKWKKGSESGKTREATLRSVPDLETRSQVSKLAAFVKRVLDESERS